MKRAGVILGIFAFLLLIAVSTSATTWLTYREDVSISSGTVDISLTYWHNQTTTTTYRNITLPCQLGQLNRTVSKFAIKANGGNIVYNLTVNGVAIKSSQTVTDGNWDNTTLTNIISGGVDQSDTYLNFTFNASANTNIIKIVIFGNDSALTSTWISSHVTVKEKDVTEPEVGVSSTSSFWTVNDSITVTNTGLGYALSDINLTLSYPSHKISIPTSYATISSLSDSNSATRYVQYQKYAPYIYKVDDKSEGTNHEVVVYIKSNEVLTNCVDWILDPDDDVYDGAFDNLNVDTLTIEYNGVEFDEWEVDEDGNIVLEDFTVREQYTLNKFVFTWTEAMAVTPAEAEVPWYEQTYFGIPAWVILAVVLILIIAVILSRQH